MTSGRTLVLLRHGRTRHNHEGRIQGQSDAELDETGHAQAERAAHALAAAYDVAALWSSDLIRASTTAGYLARATGSEPNHDLRLREYALGQREELTHAAYAAAHPEEFARFRLGDFDVVPGGESTAAVATRMVAALGELLDVTPPAGVGVAVSHGAAIRVATAALLGWPPEARGALHGLDNCGWVVLDEHRPDPDLPRLLRLRAYNRAVPTGVDDLETTAPSPGFVIRGGVG